MSRARTEHAAISSASYVGSGELSRRLGVSLSTLKWWRQIGLPFVGGGAIRPRYNLEQVEAWLRAVGRRPGGGAA